MQDLRGEKMELKISKLTKRYKNKTALDGIDLTLGNGVYALLGPNGAGKSTLMNIIVGLLRQTNGSVTFDGREILSLGADYRTRLGFMPQDTGFYPSFTGEEMMRYFAAVKGMKKARHEIDELLEFVNLTDDKKRKCGEYSGGMKRRLGIAAALLGGPDILVFDEPTAGLDPKERMRFRNILSRIGRGKLLLIATHIVSDIESISDNVILLDGGKVVKSGTLAEVISSAEGCVWELECEDGFADEYALLHTNSAIIKTGGGTRLHIVQSSKPFENAVSVSPTLEDVYMLRFGQVSGQ